MPQQTFFIDAVFKAFIDGALTTNVARRCNGSALLGLFDSFKRCLLLTFLAYPIDNNEALSFQYGVLKEV